MTTLTNLLDFDPAQLVAYCAGLGEKPFRAKLEAAGFYKEWRGKYGDEAWAVLEKYAGKIS